MDLFKQFLAENWEWIAGALGLGAGGIGGKKALKKYQNQRDGKQETRITKLETRMGNVEDAIKDNTKDDLSFRENIEKLIGETNDKLSSFMDRYVSDKDSAQTKLIEKLEAKIEKLSQ